MAVARALEGRQSVDAGGRPLRRCPRPGCTKTCPPGEKTCFDHIDLEELEADIASNDDELPDLTSSATSTAIHEVPAREEREEERPSVAIKVTCPKCGKEFPNGHPGQHIAKCKGPVETEGRIAAATRTASASRPRRADPPRAKKASRKRSAVPGRARRVRADLRGAVRRVESAAAISPAAFIAALKTERAKIDAAIAAVEALA